MNAPRIYIIGNVAFPLTAMNNIIDIILLTGLVHLQ